MHEPLYTAGEMREAEARYPGYPDSAPELMARAGRAVAEEAMRRFPDAQRFVAVCGGGANGGDGRIALEVLESAGKIARAAEDAPVEASTPEGRSTATTGLPVALIASIARAASSRGSP